MTTAPPPGRVRQSGGEAAARADRMLFYRNLTRVSPGDGRPIPYYAMPIQSWLDLKSGNVGSHIPDFRSRFMLPDSAGRIPESLFDMVVSGHYAVGIPRMGWDSLTYSAVLDLDVRRFPTPDMHQDVYWLNLIEDRPEPRPVFGRSAGGGVHLYWIFEKPIPARDSRRFLHVMIDRLGLPSPPITEMFPTKDEAGTGKEPDKKIVMEPIDPIPRDYADDGQDSPWMLHIGESRLLSALQVVEVLAAYQAPNDLDDSEAGGSSYVPRDPRSYAVSSNPATPEKLKRLFRNCKKPQVRAAYFQLPQTREGSRHRILLQLAGYVAGTDPTLTGVVEVMNAKMAEPMAGTDPTLIGLIRSHEGWRLNRAAALKGLKKNA